MQRRFVRLISLVTGALVLAATFVIAPTPAGAELDEAVYRTDGVDGRYEGVTTNTIPAHVWDIEIIGNTAYVAGIFQDVIEARGSWPSIEQPHLAAFDATSGEWIEWWTPQIDAPVWALDQTADGSLLVGGEFDTVNGETRGNLVALDPRTAEIDDRFYAEVERPWTTQQSVVRDIYTSGADTYIIGNFSHVTGGPGAVRTRFFKTARLDSTDGTPDTAWKPEISGRSGWGIAPSTDGERVHLGGEFSYVNGEPDTRQIATVDSVTGALVPGWDHGPHHPDVSFWPVGGIVFDLDVYGDNLFIGGAEHFWEMRDSSTGESLILAPSTNDTQNVETIGDRVYIGCHCDGRRHYSPGKQMREIDGATGAELPDITEPLQSGDGGWAAAKAPDGCLWLGGDFRGTTELAGQGQGQYWVGRVARICDEAGPLPHNVPSLEPPGAELELVSEGDAWRYLSDGTHPNGWTATDFDDSGWNVGAAELGFGDGDETTVVPETADGERVSSVLFRRDVEIADPAAVPYLDLRLNVDDGATVWLNGTPVVAENMPSGEITADTLASAAVWGPAERDFSDYRIPSSMLVAGTNSVAVSVHQSWVNSSDLTFDLSLAVGIGDAGGVEPQPDIQVAGPPPPDAVELVALDATWRYLDDGSDQGTAWIDPAFDDSGWAVGEAQLGYGDGDETTVVDEGRAGNGLRAVTTYFRQEFEVDDPAAFSELVLGLLRDDGAVVHLNGTELVRDNLPAGTIGYDTLALDYAYGADESTAHQFVLPTDLLQSGSNVLAVEIHSADPGSQDLSFALSLGGRA